MTTKNDDKCKQCGACRTCDFCACCGKCRECGKAKQAAVNPIPCVPLPYPVPAPRVAPWWQDHTWATGTITLGDARPTAEQVAAFRDAYYFDTGLGGPCQ